MESPIVFGMVLVFLFVLILCGATLGALYWKNLATVAKTQQIACPLNKFCPAGTNDAGHVAGVQVVFPSDTDDFTDGEYLSFPYYDDFNTPTEKTITVGFDTSTAAPSPDTTYLGLTGVGYDDYDSAATPNIQIYINGLSSYTDASAILADLVREALTQSTSPTRKKAFMNVDIGQNSGNDYMSYQVKVHGFSENIGDLNVNSSESSSTILSGTNTLVFALAPTVNPDTLVDVYQDMNTLNKLQIAPVLAGTSNNSSCVEPSFNSASCANREYNADYGVWVDPEWDPSSAASPPKITDSWADFLDSDTSGNPQFCSFNLDQTNAVNSGSDSGVAGGSGKAGILGYQQQQAAPGVTSNIAKDKNLAFPYTLGVNGPTAQPTFFYDQGAVFCGGAESSKTGTNLTGAHGNLPAKPSDPYLAKFPNPNTRGTPGASNSYTNLGWPST